MVCILGVGIIITMLIIIKWKYPKFFNCKKCGKYNTDENTNVNNNINSNELTNINPQENRTTPSSNQPQVSATQNQAVETNNQSNTNRSRNYRENIVL